MGGGLIAFLFVPNDPATARFLSNEERALAEARVRREHVGTKVLIEATKTKLLLKAFKNLNVSTPSLHLD